MTQEPMADLLARLKVLTLSYGSINHQPELQTAKDLHRLLAIVEGVVTKEREWRERNELVWEQYCANQLAELLRGDGDG